MGFMVLREENGPAIVQLFPDKIRKPQLLLKPEGHGFKERPNSNGGVGEIGFQNPLKLDKRLVIEDDIVEVFDLNLPDLKTGADCIDRKIEVVFPSGKALLLSGCDDLSIPYKGSSTVVIECRDAQDIHISSPLS